jgi:hypothetical protein
MWVLIKNALARALQLHIRGGSQLLPNLEFDYQIAFTKRVGALGGGRGAAARRPWFGPFGALVW